MKIFSLFLLLISFNGHACKLTRRIVSLSGTMTHLMDALNLTQDSNLIGISSFHHTKNEFKGKVFAGGIFLSKKEIKNYKNDVFFYDTSRDLKKNLEHLKIKELNEVKTRGLNSFEVYELSKKLLSPYISKCDQKLTDLDKQVAKIKTDIEKNKNSQLKSLFFLGECKGKLPATLMLADGPVKLLLDYKVIKSYPSELAYVNWSQKILSKLKGYKYFCLSNKKKNSFYKKNKKTINIYDQNVFFPGITQLEFVSKFLKNQQELY